MFAALSVTGVLAASVLLMGPVRSVPNFHSAPDEELCEGEPSLVAVAAPLPYRSSLNSSAPAQKKGFSRFHPAPPASSAGTEGAVGMYLTARSMSRKDFFLETLDATAKRGGNAVIFDAKGSAVYFDTSAPLAQELGLVQSQYDLPNIIEEAKRRGIYTLARYIAVKDYGLTSARPETLIVHPVTGRRIGYEYVDPESPIALQYNREILCALAKTGIDEINLDYIRFSTEQVGELRIFPVEEKSRKVEAFVRMAREAINECNPKTKLGISTYAILGWNFPVNLETLGQHVINFAPYVDIISPMAYPSTFAAGAYYNPAKHPISRMYYLVHRTLTGYQALLGPVQSKKLRPWIQGYGVTVKNMQDQMKAVYDAGLCGFTVWNANNNYGPTYPALAGWKRPAGCASTL